MKDNTFKRYKEVIKHDIKEEISTSVYPSTIKTNHKLGKDICNTRNKQRNSIQTYREFLRCQNGIPNVPYEYTYDNIFNLISNLRNAN